jgi:hypothetical protein
VKAIESGDLLAVLTMTATEVMPGTDGVQIIAVNTELEGEHISRAHIIPLLQEFVNSLIEDEENAQKG